jgi:DNA-binding transcriptional MerR regulator
MERPPAPSFNPGAAPGSSRRAATCTIGEAAARTGVSADTIRYYERIGLLPAPPRSAAGYRRYADDGIARILIVRSAARFGFSLKELAGFLQSRRDGRAPCRSVRAAGARLLDDVDKRIAELIDARAAMAATLADWDERLARGEPARLLETLTDAGQADVAELTPLTCAAGPGEAACTSAARRR